MGRVLRVGIYVRNAAAHDGRPNVDDPDVFQRGLIELKGLMQILLLINGYLCIKVLLKKEIKISAKIYQLCLEQLRQRGRMSFG